MTPLLSCPQQLRLPPPFVDKSLLLFLFDPTSNVLHLVLQAVATVGLGVGVSDKLARNVLVAKGKERQRDREKERKWEREERKKKRRSEREGRREGGGMLELGKGDKDE